MNRPDLFLEGNSSFTNGMLSKKQNKKYENHTQIRLLNSTPEFRNGLVVMFASASEQLLTVEEKTVDSSFLPSFEEFGFEAFHDLVEVEKRSKDRCELLKDYMAMLPQTSPTDMPRAKLLYERAVASRKRACAILRRFSQEYPQAYAEWQARLDQNKKNQ